MSLTEDDVLQILKLIEQSTFDELHLELGDLRLSLTGPGRPNGSAGVSDQAPRGPDSAERPARGPAEVDAAPVDAAARDSEAGLIPISSPTVGLFRRRPAPGAPPYAEIGTPVAEEDTVGVIEVVDVLREVKAGVRGRIERVCAESGQFVEYGAPLFLVRPAA